MRYIIWLAVFIFNTSGIYGQNIAVKCEQMFREANDSASRGNYSFALDKLSAIKIINETLSGRVDEEIIKLYKEIDKKRLEAEQASFQAKKERTRAEKERMRAEEQTLLAVKKQKELEKTNRELNSQTKAVEARMQYEKKFYTEGLHIAKEAYNICPTTAALTVLKDICSDSEGVFYNKIFVPNLFNFTTTTFDCTSILTPDAKYHLSAGRHLLKYSFYDSIYTDIEPSRGPIQQIAFSGNGKIFATMHEYGNVTIWSYPELKEIYHLPGRKKSDGLGDIFLKKVALSYTGDKIIISREDTLMIYNLNDSFPVLKKIQYYRIREILTPPNCDSFYLNFSGDVVKMAYDGTIHGHFRPLSSGSSVVVLSPDGNYLGAGDYKSDTVVIYDLKHAPKLLYTIKTGYIGTKAISFSHDNTKLIISTDGGGSLLYLLGSEKPKRTLKTITRANSVYFLPNDNEVVIADLYTSYLWQLEDLIKEKRCHTKYVNLALYMPNDSILTASVDNDIKTWDSNLYPADTFSLVRSLRMLPLDSFMNNYDFTDIYTTRVSNVFISPRSRFFIVFYSNGLINVWDRYTKKLAERFNTNITAYEQSERKKYLAPFSKVAFSGDEKFAAFNTSNDTITLYSFDDNQHYRYNVGKNKTISQIVFSDDNKHLCFSHTEGVETVNLESKQQALNNSFPKDYAKNVIWMRYRNNTTLLCVQQDGKIVELDCKSQKSKVYNSSFEAPQDIIYLPEFNSIVAINNSHDVAVVNLDKDECSKPISSAQTINKLLPFSKEKIIIQKKDSIEIWDIHQKIKLGSFHCTDEPFIDIYPIPAQDLVAVSERNYQNTQGKISVYNLQGMEMQAFQNVTFSKNAENPVSGDGRYMLGVPCNHYSNDESYGGSIQILKLIQLINPSKNLK